MKNKKNLLTFLYLKTKGPAQICARIFKSLKEEFNIYLVSYEDNEVFNLFFDKDITFIDYKKLNQKKIINFNEIIKVDKSVDSKSIKDIKKTCLLLDKIKPDLVFYFGTFMAQTIKYIKSINQKLPIMSYNAMHPQGIFNKTNIHDANIKKLLKERLKYSFELSDCVLLIQKEAGNYISKKFDVKKMKYFGYEIDLKKYKENVKKYIHILPKKKKKWIISVGSLQKRKNQILLIKAFKKLKDINDYKLFFIGDGVDYNFLNEEVERLNLKKHVVFLKEVTSALPFISIADLVVHTSYCEGIANVICEAFALKTPVISTSWPGVNEIIDDKKNGLISDFKVKELVLKIESIFEDKALKNTIVKNAYKKILNFDINKKKKFYLRTFKSNLRKNVQLKSSINNYLNKLIKEKISIYGSGTLAIELLNKYKKLNVHKVYDSDTLKWNKEFFNHKIFEFNTDKIEKDEKIIVCSQKWNEITKFLIQQKVNPEIIYIYI